MPELFRFNYVISGPAEKPKILFLHGFMGRIDEWQVQKEDLSPHFQCLFVDLPGHGATEVREKSAYDFVTCASGIVRFLEKLKFKPVHIIGYSLGGRIALYIALFWPNLVRRLILESASPGIAGEKDRLIRLKQDALIAQQIKDRWPEFVDKWYRQPLFTGISESPGFDTMLVQKKRNDPEKLAWNLTGMGQGAQPSLWNDLQNLQASVLLIIGERDSKYMRISDKMREKIPQCKRSVVSECSHNTHLQNPVRFNSEIRRFLSDM